MHLLGARKELDQLPLFLESAWCLSGLWPQLHLVLCGEDVPTSLDGASHVSACGRLRVQMARTVGGYTMPAHLPTPHLLFAPNAGVAAYPSEWRRTCLALQSARSPSLPLVVTDWTEEAALMAQRALTEAGGLRLVRPVARNACRGLLARADPHWALPAYSNGWLLVVASSSEPT